MINQIKTLIIDNDPIIIESLKTKLLSNPQIDFAGEACTVCQGIQLIHETLPDLLFLNIEMPEKSGFDIVKTLKNQQISMPLVVFITNHTEFILQALRIGAIDYLLKPINENELSQAINKAFAEINGRSQLQKIDYLLNYVSRYKQIFLPSSTGYKSINIRDVFYIRKNIQNEKIELIFGENDFLVLPKNYNLTQLSEILNKSDFFLIKRELLINIRYLSDIEVYNKVCILQKGEYTIKLPMSRRSLKEFKDKMVI